MDDEGQNDRALVLSTLQSALRTILLEDPAAIEGLPRPRAARLEALLDANGLHPILYDAIRRDGRESVLSGARLAAWKGSYLLALARGTAYSAALEEIADIGARLGIPLRLLREAHMAFRVHAKPELRPIHEIEVQVPAREAREVQAALRSRRFTGIEPLVRRGPSRVREHLLEREGVIVKLRCGPALEREAPWDAFPPEGSGSSRSMPLAAEAALILHAHEVACRSACHSLGLLNDIRVLLESSPPSWSQVLSLATGSGTVAAVYLSLALLRQLFGIEVEAAFLRKAEVLLGLPSTNFDLLVALCLSAILERPAAPRLAAFIEATLESVRVEPVSSVVGEPAGPDRLP